MNWSMTANYPLVVVFSSPSVQVYDSLEKRIKSRFNNSFVDVNLRMNSNILDSNSNTQLIVQHIVNTLENYKVNNEIKNEATTKIISDIMKILGESE